MMTTGKLMGTLKNTVQSMLNVLQGSTTLVDRNSYTSYNKNNGSTTSTLSNGKVDPIESLKQEMRLNSQNSEPSRTKKQSKTLKSPLKATDTTLTLGKYSRSEKDHLTDSAYLTFNCKECENDFEVMAIDKNATICGPCDIRGQE